MERVKVLEAALKEAKEGAIQFRVEKEGIVHASIGKISFTNEKLIGNIRSFMVALIDAKPEGFKGSYIEAASLCSTMGPGVAINVPTIDPANPKFMLDPSLLVKAK